MAGYLEVLEVDDWKDHPALQTDIGEEMTIIGKQFDKLIRDGNSTVEAKKDFANRFDRLLTAEMIRRAPDTKWFDSHLISVQVAN